MHRLFKLLWGARALFYKLIFGRLSIPSYIGPPVFLMNTRRMYIGKRVRIFPGLRAECHGEGQLFVHDNVSIGQGFHVIASGDLHIETGCLISANVFVTDTDHTFDRVDKPVFDQPDRIRPTRIGENCFLGIGVRIQAGTILGKGCVVGANSVVRGEFPDHCVIVGAPARVIKHYDPALGQWQRC
ncbi:acyltransferase [Pseudomonas tussilaginis]|uniref:acyltransferase n=1 Tax=unclassified Pseudomonas TaxID=196821 RepID=UPI000C6EB659|nr:MULTISPECIES: acyltransferase [unclassified Pseudomonas]QYX47691.1 acyltransferase [Pseudomonas sp. S11A 273]